MLPWNLSAKRTFAASLGISKDSAAVVLSAVIRASIDRFTTRPWRKIIHSETIKAAQVSSSTAPLVNRITAMSFCRMS